MNSSGAKRPREHLDEDQNTEPTETDAVHLHKRRGWLEALKLESVKVEHPREGEILVDLSYALVTNRDALMGMGVGVKELKLPCILGTQAAGVIRSVGGGVSLKQGDHVVYIQTSENLVGSFAGSFKLAAKDVITVPKPLSNYDFADDLALFHDGLIVSYLLHVFKVEDRHTVLIPWVDGSCSAPIICLWAKSVKATVIGTVLDKENEEIAKAHGCEFVVKEKYFSKAVEDFLKSKGKDGVDFVFSCAGKDPLEDCIKTLKKGGTMVDYQKEAHKVETAPTTDGSKKLIEDGGISYRFVEHKEMAANKEVLTGLADALVQRARKGGWMKYSIHRYNLGEFKKALQEVRDITTRHKKSDKVFIHPKELHASRGKKGTSKGKELQRKRPIFGTVDAVRVNQYGVPKPEELKLETVYIDEPEEGEILVDVEFAPLSSSDSTFRAKKEGLALPFTLGFEAVGRVRKTGPGVNELKVGNSVFYIGPKTKPIGSFSSMLLMREVDVITIPHHQFESEKAVALLHNGLFPGLLVREIFKVNGSHTIFVNSFDGSRFAPLICLWAKALGATVYTACRKENEKAAKRFGCDATFSTTKFSLAVKRVTSEEGVDCVFDCIGQNTFEECLKSLKVDGSMVCYKQVGTRERDHTTTVEGNIAEKSLSVAYVDPGNMFTAKEKLGKLAQELFEKGKDKGWCEKLEVKSYAFKEVSKAHAERSKTSSEHTILLQPVRESSEDDAAQVIHGQEHANPSLELDPHGE